MIFGASSKKADGRWPVSAHLPMSCGAIFWRLSGGSRDGANGTCVEINEVQERVNQTDGGER